MLNLAISISLYKVLSFTLFLTTSHPNRWSRSWYFLDYAVKNWAENRRCLKRPEGKERKG